ncbi:MAG TPA: Ti-type conjugative transfer relaxase TraA [Acidocella sp.]|nr:Ti-type conjugative transfer relaxase TraA [Acidocella sp.]
MAIYHMSMKPVARGSGRSAVAASAYRAADRLENVRDGMVHDFSRRHGVEHAEIILPNDTVAANGAVVHDAGPEWARDRSALWNAAELAERRKDARVAREIEVALPHELSAEQRLSLTRDFAQALARQYGVAVDFAIHVPHGHTDVRNHHAHILLTTRRVMTGRDEAGRWIGAMPAGSLGEKSELELENKKLQALGLPTSHEQLRDLRIGWEQRTNEHLARAGLDVRIDHRSHQERGLEIEPTQHMGVHATQMERRGKAVSRVRIDEDAAKRNAALIRERPDQVLTLITGEKSVFDRHDVARALHRYIGDADAFQAAFATVMASPALVELRAEQRDKRGRVIEQARYSTREMVGIERDMAVSADRMAEGRGGLPVRGFGVAARRVDAAVSARPFLAEEQRAAIEHVCRPERISAVVGLAGAGKSTMLAAAREAWVAQGYHVHGAALAGKAAEGLEESAGIASRTLASWERGWERGFDRLGPRDVLVIDEAGMVGSKQLSRFITEADRAGAKIVLVGDPEQLQPIGPGAAFRAVAERIGFVDLAEIRRQREGWQRAASVAFGRHQTEEGLRAYAERDAVRFEATAADARTAIVRDVLADMDVRPDGSRLVLAHRNADVRELNEAIRVVRRERGELADERVYRTTEGERAFAPGDRLLFRENNRELGVKNGMLGTVELAEDDRLLVRLDSPSGPGRGRAVSVSMADYAAVDHGYATTIHKAQGATVDRAYVLASGTMDRHLTYVAMTRHRDGVTLYADREEFSTVAALSSWLSRSQAKETTLDYDQAAYAQRRGVEVRPREVVAAREIEAGRAGFRARFEAHRQHQAAEAARNKEAHGLVREWTRLSETYNKALPGLETDPTLAGQARVALLGFARTLDRHSEAAQRLRARGHDFGLKEGSALAQVLASPDAGQAIERLMAGAEERMRGHLAREAERAAVRKQQERSVSRGRGMSM